MWVFFTHRGFHTPYSISHVVILSSTFPWPVHATNIYWCKTSKSIVKLSLNFIIVYSIYHTKAKLRETTLVQWFGVVLDSQYKFKKISLWDWWALLALSRVRWSSPCPRYRWLPSVAQIFVPEPIMDVWGIRHTCTDRKATNMPKSMITSNKIIRYICVGCVPQDIYRNHSSQKL